MSRLILATAEGPQAIDLRPINSLGRHPNNTIQLLDKIVSKEHCILEQRDGQFILRDLGSLNGTYINGERVRGEQLLKHGDEIALGSTRARFDDGSGALPPPPISPGVISKPPPQNTGALGHPPASANPWGGAGPKSQPQGYPPSNAQSSGAHVSPYSVPPSTHATAQSAQRPGAYGPHPGLTHDHPSPVPPASPSLAPPSGVAPKFRPAAGGLSGTRVDLSDSARAIGTQIAAHMKGFLPYEQIAHDPQQMRLDYERLRVAWDLTRDIGNERDLDQLLEKIIRALFKFVNADRGIILLRDDEGVLQPRALHRRDGTNTPIQISTTILNHVIRERAAVLTHDASMDFAASKGKSMILNRISSAMVAPLLHENEKEVLGAIWLDSESVAQFQAKDLEILTSVASQAAMFIENTLLAKKVEHEIVVRERFSRLVAPNVAEQMIDGRLEVKKGGTLVQECTIFNSDIRGFTTMSEGTDAEVIVEMLNEYFELMVETLFRYEGTLDKFMGDGIMAFWGAPVAHPDDPIRAVQCALDQMEVLGRFNRSRIEQNKPPLAVGIGIHTGPVVAGYVGSSKALSYTAIGDTANTSARLCSTALSGQVVVSEGTLARLGERFEVQEIEPQSLKGKEKPMRRFNIVRERPSAAANTGQ